MRSRQVVVEPKVENRRWNANVRVADSSPVINEPRSPGGRNEMNLKSSPK